MSEETRFIAATDSRELDYIFIAFIVNKRLYLEYKNFIDQVNYRYGEEYYKILSSALSQYVEKFTENTDSTDWLALDLCITDVLSSGEIYLEEDSEGIISSLQDPDETSKYRAIYVARKLEREDVAIDSDLAREKIKKFLTERLYHDKVREFGNMGAGRGQYMENLPELLQQLNEVTQSIKASGGEACYNLVPDDNIYHETPLRFVNTDIAFIDNVVGGLEVGAVSGVVGVSGAGKTTLGIHAVVSAARREYTEACEQGRQPRKAYYLSYEEAAYKLRPRVISCACNISRERLTKMTNFNTELSRELLDYDLEMQYNLAEDERLTEWDRWLLNRDFIKETIGLVDMSGSRDAKYDGNGHVDQVVALIDEECSKTGVSPLCICLDYAGLICSRYCIANNIDDSKIRTFLRTFADTFRVRVAERFDCAILALQQMNASECSASPKKAPNAFKGAEDKSFPTNMAFCGALGVPDSNGITRFSYTKTRNKSKSEIPEARLQIDKNIAKFVDVTRTTVVSSIDDSFRVRGSEADSVRQLINSRPMDQLERDLM